MNRQEALFYFVCCGWHAKILIQKYFWWGFLAMTNTFGDHIWSALPRKQHQVRTQNFWRNWNIRIWAVCFKWMPWNILKCGRFSGRSHDTENVMLVKYGSTPSPPPLRCCYCFCFCSVRSGLNWPGVRVWNAPLAKMPPRAFLPRLKSPPLGKNAPLHKFKSVCRLSMRNKGYWFLKKCLKLTK